ncbi:type II toxin-antitoxin system PemK/MazF family toxin [Corynebacterium sp. 335C]
MSNRLGDRLRDGWGAAVRVFRGPDPLDGALAQLTEQLGLAVEDDDAAATERREAVTVAKPAAKVARSIVYAPDMDGHADSGEIVFAPVQLDGESSASHERAVVVIGRHRRELLGALISADARHADDDRWLYIGTGSFEGEARPSWVRLDRVLVVPESGIRRSGTVLPRRRFERIAHRLRADYGWT